MKNLKNFVWAYIRYVLLFEIVEFYSAPLTNNHMTTYF